MGKENVLYNVARNMMSYHMETIARYCGYMRTNLDSLSKYASIIYGTPLKAYLSSEYGIAFNCTDPSSPKYTDKDLTLDDIL